jgi:hypothetical protein
MAQIDLVNGPSSLVALLISVDEGIRSALRRPFMSLAFVFSVAFGAAIALVISATGRGTEATVKDLLDSRAGPGQLSFADVDSVLRDASSLLTQLAGLFTIVLVIAINVQTKADRQREIRIKRQRGVHVWEILFELFTEALLLSIIGAVVGVAFGIGLAELVPRHLPSLHTTVAQEDMINAAGIVIAIGVISLMAVGVFILKGQVLPSVRRR